MPFIDFDSTSVFEILPGFEARLHHSDQLTFGKVHIRKGALLPEHHHFNEQVTIVLEGRLKFTIEGETKILEVGMVAQMPPHARHSAEALTDVVVFDYFYPLREEYR